MTLAWWTAALPNMEPRVATPKTDRTDRIVYTDAAGKSRIIAAVIIDPTGFKHTKYLRSVTHVRTGKRWVRTFAYTSYIYGLEMLTILATLMERGDDIRNQSVTFYIDNNNALLAILKNSAKPVAIQAMTGLIWHRIQELNITPWFERVPSKRNIADLPTRHVKNKIQVTQKDEIPTNHCPPCTDRNCHRQNFEGPTRRTTFDEKQKNSSPFRKTYGTIPAEYKLWDFFRGNEGNTSVLRTIDTSHREMKFRQNTTPSGAKYNRLGTLLPNPLQTLEIPR